MTLLLFSDSFSAIIAFDDFFYPLIKEKRFARSFKLIFPLLSFTQFSHWPGNWRILIIIRSISTSNHPLQFSESIFLDLKKQRSFVIALLLLFFFFLELLPTLSYY